MCMVYYTFDYEPPSDGSPKQALRLRSRLRCFVVLNTVIFEGWGYMFSAGIIENIAEQARQAVLVTQVFPKVELIPKNGNALAGLIAWLREPLLRLRT